jgi:hypothetical protein
MWHIVGNVRERRAGRQLTIIQECKANAIMSQTRECQQHVSTPAGSDLLFLVLYGQRSRRIAWFLGSVHLAVKCIHVIWLSACML